jgi:RNA polymerase subunit RPABC4/transcription elongation factor Spt4
MRGLTTFEEVLRVTHADTDSILRCERCERRVAADMLVCPWCAAELDTGRCRSCQKPVQPEWHVCPYCREPTAHGRREAERSTYIGRRSRDE